MEYARIGVSDINVSRVGVGTWAMGGTGWGAFDERAALEALATAFDLGINFIDTAPAYGLGAAERLVGRAIGAWGKREQVVLATKVGLDWDRDGRLWRNANPKRIRQEVEQSLRRLDTEYIDLCQVHWPDPATPIYDVADALFTLYREGKIRAIGVSNFDLDQVHKWQSRAPLHSNQLQFSMIQRQLLPVICGCEEQRIATLTWGSLAHGLLTGKYSSQSDFPDNDFRSKNPIFKEFGRYRELLAVLRQVGCERGKSIAQIAVRWVLQQQGVTTVLWGVRNPDQVSDIPGVLNWVLDSVEIAQLDGAIGECASEMPELTSGPPPRSNV